MNSQPAQHPFVLSSWLTPHHRQFKRSAQFPGILIYIYFAIDYSRYQFPPFPRLSFRNGWVMQTLPLPAQLSVFLPPSASLIATCCSKPIAAVLEERRKSTLKCFSQTKAPSHEGRPRRRLELITCIVNLCFHHPRIGSGKGRSRRRIDLPCTQICVLRAERARILHLASQSGRRF